MQIGTNTEFPSHLGDMPEDVKVPDGNVFKFALYGVGVLDYKFNASDSTWKICKGETFLVNHPDDFSSFNASSIVATTSSSALDQFGNTHNGALKSLIPGDASFASGESVNFKYDTKSNTVRWSLGRIKTSQGVFSDITHIIGYQSAKHDLSEGSHPDGYVRSVAIDIVSLFYCKE
uniref:Low-molecular weight cobalt-containing nitrile hydratase subunit beta n=1 Tax=Anthurium amnicola TaxID=1678845 RepID=A0A1D1ZGB0_9ARAE